LLSFQTTRLRHTLAAFYKHYMRKKNLGILRAHCMKLSDMHITTFNNVLKHIYAMCIYYNFPNLIKKIILANIDTEINGLIDFPFWAPAT